MSLAARVALATSMFSVACASSQPASPAAEHDTVVVALPAPASAIAETPAGEASSALAPAPAAQSAPASSLAAELDQLDLQIVSALSTATPPLTRTLSRPASGGAFTPGSGGQGAGGIGTVSGVGTGSKTKAVQGPKGTAAVTIDRDDSHSSNSAAVVAGMNAGFRRCYQRALNSDPGLRGKTTVKATLGSKGEVLSTASKSPFAPEVTACVSARIAAAQFAAPTSMPSELVLTVRFEPAP